MDMAPFAGTNRIRFDGCDLSRGRGTPVPSGYQPIIREVRVLAALCLLGLWQAAAALGGPLVVTALCTAAATAAGVWAIAVLRER
jgi:hypothetical protein